VRPSHFIQSGISSGGAHNQGAAAEVDSNGELLGLTRQILVLTRDATAQRLLVLQATSGTPASCRCGEGGEASEAYLCQQ